MSSSSSPVTSFFFNLIGLNKWIYRLSPFLANCSNSTSDIDDVLLYDSSPEDIFNWKKFPKKNSLTSGNFLRNTLTRSDMIESYRTYCVTSSYPQKIFVNFRGMKKLFYMPDPSLSSKLMNQCRLKFSGTKNRAKISFQRHFV